MHHRSSFFLCFLLIALLSLSTSFTDASRGKAVSTLADYWKALVKLKILLQTPFSPIQDIPDEVLSQEQEIQRLILENQLLMNEVHDLRQMIEHEYQLLEEMLQDSAGKEVPLELVSRREREVLARFELQLVNVPAKVIFRPVNAWNSSLWIDKGEEDNERLGRQVIAKNSPVVLGTSVIGVVDYVGEKQSRVRLITDSGLNPSVRIKRGRWLLAKGELKGECHPLARSLATRLIGVGFNYDYPDSSGPARDLRTGEPQEKGLSKTPAMPLVQVNDLLVTTGMDGVFPEGLEVGIVKKIHSLKEGDDSFDLEAESTAGDLNSLSLVFILPPI